MRDVDDFTNFSLAVNEKYPVVYMEDTPVGRRQHVPASKLLVVHPRTYSENPLCPHYRETSSCCIQWLLKIVLSQLISLQLQIKLARPGWTT